MNKHNIINVETYNKDQHYKKKKRIISFSALAAATALTAILIIPAGAQETEKAALTYNSTSGEHNISSTSYNVLTDVSGVVESLLPSVVSITSRSLYNNYNDLIGNGYNPEDIINYFFGNSGDQNGYGQATPGNNSDNNSENNNENADNNDHSNEVESGLGSGTIITVNDTEVLILTSYHVVENCSSLYVTFNNNVNVDGKVKSSDTDKDIAIISVSVKDIDKDTLNSIKAASIAASEPKVGEGVIVIGNALGYGISVTTGILSAVDRQITVEGKTLNVIQTDAAINKGNSGGCMLNTNGEVIGISEAKVNNSSVEGICYAIPVVANKALIEKLVNSEGTYASDIQTDNGGYLGIQGTAIDSNMSKTYRIPVGIYIANTIKGSGAQAAGIKEGDVITAIDGIIVTTMKDLSNKVISHFPGDTVRITIARSSGGDYELQDFLVVLTERLS